jgi:carbon storage regulator
MLIFSRKCGERFVIGDEITVTVRRIQGNRVTLSFEAPSTVRIARQEAKNRPVACEVVPASDSPPAATPACA